MAERKGTIDQHIAEKRSATMRRKVKLTPLSDVEMRPTYWLWKDGAYLRIPIGELSLFAGHGDVGKSTCSAWLIAEITRGRLPGRYFGKPRNCIITAPEDSLERTIKPRLFAAGADMDRVFCLEARVEAYEDIGVALSLPHDFTILEEAINQTKSVAVFFDSLMSTIEMKYDTHKGRDARQALQPLGGIANRTRCSIIGNVHFNKASSSDPAARMLGSVEIRNVARAVIYFAHRDGIRVLSRGKGNLGVEWPPMEYTIEDGSFRQGRFSYHPGRFVLGEESDVTAEDILREENKGNHGVSQRRDAVVWLVGYLADHDNKVELGKIKDAADMEGFTWSTVEKAKKEAGIESSRSGFGKGSVMYWYRANSAKTRQKVARRGNG